MVSVVILTFQEEISIKDCLESLEGFDDVHIVDSGSTDRTLEIAAAYPCRIATHPFRSFGDQRNWALKTLDLRYDWILFLDADERITPAFKTALMDEIRRSDSSVAGFYCCWKLMLENTWLKRSDFFPRWQFRLLHKDRACFQDFGHGQKESIISGKIDYLHEPYLHYAFLKGWNDWWNKHLRYAAQEAKERSKYRFRFQELLSSHASIRNKSLKTLLTRLPWWPFVRWFYPWGIRGGFLDGKNSFQYCWKISRFEKEVQSQLRIIERNRRLSKK